MDDFFPAILEGPDPTNALYGVYVVGNGINGCGATGLAAMKDAALILQEVIDDAVADREPVPTPREPRPDDLARGTLVLLPAKMPVVTA